MWNAAKCEGVCRIKIALFTLINMQPHRNRGEQSERNRTLELENFILKDISIERERDRDRQRETETDRQTDRQRQRDRERERE